MRERRTFKHISEFNSTGEWNGFSSGGVEKEELLYEESGPTTEEQ